MRTHAIAIVSLALGLAGCVEAFNPLESGLARSLFGDTINEAEIASLEEKRDRARLRYDARLAAYVEEIREREVGLARGLEEGDLSGALEDLTGLYALTHPCGEEDCGTYPCPEGTSCLDVDYRYDRGEVFMEREELDPRVELLESGVEGVWRLVDAYVEARRFDEVDVALGAHLERIPFASRNGARFTSRHAEVRARWVETLERDARAARKARLHAHAALLFSKASSLAQALEDAERGSSNLETARAERLRGLEACGYTVRVSGEGKLAEAVRGHAFSSRVEVVGGRARAEVTVREGAPSYTRRVVETTGSFEYVSGTKQVENPAWRSQNRACESAQTYYDLTYRSCERHGYGTYVNANCQDGELDEKERARDEACGALRGIERTHSEDVYATETYPVRRHQLVTTLPIGFSLAPSSKRRGARRASVASTVHDDEHAAHSRGGAGVSADPANPPSKAAGLDAAYRDARTHIVSAIVGDFRAHRDQLARSARGKGRVDALACAYLLEPDGAPKTLLDDLIEASGISDAASMLRRLQAR